MRVVVAAIPFGSLESISARQVVEQALLQATVPYEVTQTALLLDPGAQVNSFLRAQPPFLYVLVDQLDLGIAQSAIQAVAPHSLEV